MHSRKKLRGQSYLRPGEGSKINCNLSLSETVIEKLETLSKQEGKSKSEYIECWIRSIC